MSEAVVLTTDQIEQYRSAGFLRVRGVFGQAETDRVRKLIYCIYRKFRPDDGKLDELEVPWNELAFDRAMIALRESSPREFGALYDCAQSAIPLVSLVTDPRLVRLAALCLADPASTLSYSGIMLRMDPPRDTRNAIDWHQDRAYYPQNVDGNHGLVATVALQDIAAESGALKLCPGSHAQGLVTPVARTKDSYETTEQRMVPGEAVAGYAQVDAEMKRGDVLLMNLNVFHRSGSNVRERMRYTALCRFHRVMAPDYVPFGLIYQFNDFMRKGTDRT